MQWKIKVCIVFPARFFRSIFAQSWFHFTTKRANARRAGDPDRKLLGLPEVSFSAPGQAGKKRKMARSRRKGPVCVIRQLLATITVAAYPLDPQFVGIDLGNYGLVGDWGSIVPPNINGAPNNVFGLILGAGTPNTFAVTQITGFAPAASNYQVNVKITNVTNRAVLITKFFLSSIAVFISLARSATKI